MCLYVPTQYNKFIQRNIILSTLNNRSLKKKVLQFIRDSKFSQYFNTIKLLLSTFYNQPLHSCFYASILFFYIAPQFILDNKCIVKEFAYSREFTLYMDIAYKVRINLPLFSTVVPAVIFFCPVGLSLL